MKSKTALKKAFVQLNFSITYFGDGLWDKHTSEALSFNFVAVGDRASHHSCIKDFNDLDNVCRLAGLSVSM